jgi:hypothetical protein
MYETNGIHDAFYGNLHLWRLKSLYNCMQWISLHKRKIPTFANLKFQPFSLNRNNISKLDYIVI